MLTPLQMEAIAKEQIRDRERALQNEMILKRMRSMGIVKGSSLGMRLIAIVLKLERTLMQWLARDYQQRSLHNAVTTAFVRFSSLHPRWVALHFDYDFVTRHLLPMLILAIETGVPVTSEQVAEQYAVQISPFPQLRAHYQTEVMPAAACFLHLVDTALEDTRMTIPATGTQLVSHNLTALS